MARPPIPLDTNDLVARYADGESVLSIAKALKVSHTTVQDRLRKAGVLRSIAEDLRSYKRATMTSLPTKTVVKLFNNGNSIMSLSKMFEVSRSVIRLRLIEAGVLPGDNRTTKHSRAADPNRSCHVSSAKVAELRGYHIGSGERWLTSEFKKARLKVREQAAVGPYNVDILVRDTIAVEVMTCAGTPYSSPRYTKRLEYILDRYGLLIVHCPPKHVLIPEGAKKIVSLTKRLCRSPSSVLGQYWVIRGTGELSCRGNDLDDLSLVPAPIRSRYSSR
jgi:hypothetical protein